MQTRAGLRGHIKEPISLVAAQLPESLRFTSVNIITDAPQQARTRQLIYISLEIDYSQPLKPSEECPRFQSHMVSHLHLSAFLPQCWRW